MRFAQFPLGPRHCFWWERVSDILRNRPLLGTMTSEQQHRRKGRRLALALLLLSSERASAFTSSAGVHGPARQKRSAPLKVQSSQTKGQTSSDSATSYWPPLSGKKYEEKPTNLFGGAFAEEKETFESISAADSWRLKLSKNDAAASLATAEAELSSTRFPLGSSDASPSSSGRSYWPPLTGESSQALPSKVREKN